MNSSTKAIPAMTVSTSGRSEVMAPTLSRLTWAWPVNATGRPPGVAMSCSRASCSGDAAENNGALLPTVRRALPFCIAVAATGGPIFAPPTKAPVGTLTAVTSTTRESSAA